MLWTNTHKAWSYCQSSWDSVHSIMRRQAPAALMRSPQVITVHCSTSLLFFCTSRAKQRWNTVLYNECVCVCVCVCVYEQQLASYVCYRSFSWLVLRWVSCHGVTPIRVINQHWITDTQCMKTVEMDHLPWSMCECMRVPLTAVC